MNDILEVLSLKLKDKGLMPIEVSRLIRDVGHIFDDGVFFNARTVEKRLKFLGWNDRVMDSYVLELMVFLYESKTGSEVGNYATSSTLNHYASSILSR
jgi:hypothetical protein